MNQSMAARWRIVHSKYLMFFVYIGLQVLVNNKLKTYEQT